MKTKKISILLLIIALKVSITTVFSQVVINEVMAYSTGNQGLIIFNGNSGNEYVELYNPSCSSVDVSGYFIGNRQEFSGSSGGGFRIPNVPASIIPPNGHLVLGTSTSSADPNSVDIKIPSYTYCQNSASKNFILANADGWVALYDASGTPVDAIYWSSAATNISSANDYAGIPCTPTGSPAGVVLESAQQINSGFPGVLQYVGNTTSLGKTYSRVPDGGAWVRDVTASINDLTVGNCNGGTCVTAATFSITSTVVQPTCGNPNGSITITPTSPGTYTYAWTPNVSTTSSATSLSAGSYSIQIDKNGCTKDTTITLISGSGPTAIESAVTNPDCGQNNGQVALGAVTGGTAPYEYNFNGAGYALAPTIPVPYTNLPPGSYSLLVKDATGCVYTAPNIILTSSNGPTAILVNTTNPACGISNGQVSLGAVTGGTLPYQYNFNGLGLSGIAIYTNLSAGSYSLIIEDASGCIYTSPSIVLTNANGPTAISTTFSNETCNLSNGQITLGLVTGGTPSFQYNLNGLGFSSTTSYTNLIAGTYTLVVKDQNGCTFNAPSIVLSNTVGPTSVAAITTNSTCNLSNGSIQIGLVTGGVLPYQYNFNSLGYSNLTSFLNLAATSYTLSVQDGNGCVYVSTPIILSNTSGPNDLVITTTGAACDNTNGQISINNTTGGIIPYTYSIDGVTYSNVDTYPNLLPGNYTVSVKDGNGCVYSESSIISSSSSPIASFSFYPYILKNEKEDISLTDQSMGNVVIYQWLIPDGTPNTGSSANFNTKLETYEEGFYPITLIVTNEFGCVDSITKFIERRLDPIIYIPNAFTPDDDTHNNVWSYSLLGLDLNFFSMTVFNRWGEIVWKTTDQSASWDGFYKGKRVQNGTYTWVMNAKDNVEDKHLTLNGHLSIIY